MFEKFVGSYKKVEFNVSLFLVRTQSDLSHGGNGGKYSCAKLVCIV